MCTNIEYYEHGDFLMTNNRSALIFDRKGKNGEAHYLFCVDIDRPINNSLQKCGTGERYCGYLETAFLADNEATEAIIKGLKKLGKYWNENKKRIENIGIYKEGDFLKTFRNNLFILKKIDKHEVYDHVFLTDNSLIPGESRCCYIEDIAGYCTLKEEIKIIDALKKAGKRWNAETKCIENIPIYKNGDFLRTKMGNLFIFKKFERVRNEKEDSAFCHFFTSVSSDYKGYGLNKNGVCFEKDIDRYCTPEEKQKILDDLAKDGKRWNAEKKCIEDVPVYKKGDILVNDSSSTLIFKETDGNCIFDHAYLPVYGELYIDKIANYEGVKRCVTTEEKQQMIDALAKIGKQWNAEKKCIEDIPKRKFKAGDKVRIKDGISSKTHRYVSPNFIDSMDEFIGKELTVKGYSGSYVFFNEDVYGYHFAEDWLELWDDKSDCMFKKGDRVIFSEDFSKRMRNENGHFANHVKKYIGKPLTVSKVCNNGCVWIEGEELHGFNKDWLELWSDEPKVGDWVIAWSDGEIRDAIASVITQIDNDDNTYFVGGFWFENVIKWDDIKKHIEKIRKNDLEIH